jgi:hypothetical protein
MPETPSVPDQDEAAMFRTFPRWLLTQVMTVACFCAFPVLLRAEEPKPATRVPCLIVPQDQSILIRVSSKKRIAKAACDAKCVRLAENVGDNTAVLLTAIDLGVERVALTDEDAKEEELVVYVVGPKVKEPGAVDAIQLKKDKAVILSSKNNTNIKKAVSDDEKIVQMKVNSNDGSEITLRGLSNGATLATLTGEDGKKERLLIVVGE